MRGNERTNYAPGFLLDSHREEFGRLGRRPVEQLSPISLKQLGTMSLAGLEVVLASAEQQPPNRSMAYFLTGVFNEIAGGLDEVRSAEDYGRVIGFRDRALEAAQQAAQLAPSAGA